MPARFFTLIAIVLGIASCATPTPPASDPLSQSSAVSVSMPEFRVSAETALRWQRDLIWVDDPSGVYERNAQNLQQGLQDAFERKGYRFAAGEEMADYQILAVAVLGDLAAHPQVTELFQLYPSLAGNPRDYAKGTVLVALASTRTGKVAWRGAIKVFTDPNMATVQQRQQRMQHNIKQLLASIPNV